MENIKNWRCKSYLGNKKPKATILAASSLDAHPGFDAHFCPWRIERASKIALPKKLGGYKQIYPASREVLY